jgi:hypothetical protein
MSARYLGNEATYTIFELMDYGSIVAKDEELGIILTINGAYYNGFMYVGDGHWVSLNNVWAPAWSQDAKSRGLYSELDSVRLVNIMDEGEKIIEKIRGEISEEWEDEDIDDVVEKHLVGDA